jgi:hypothetical protein
LIPAIDEVVNRTRDGTITDYKYNPSAVGLFEQAVGEERLKAGQCPLVAQSGRLARHMMSVCAGE